MRGSAVLAVVATALGLAGCGGEDEQLGTRLLETTGGGADGTGGRVGDSGGAVTGGAAGAVGLEGGGHSVATRTPGTLVTLALSDASAQTRAEVDAALAEAEGITKEELATRASLPFSTGPTYDPTQAEFMDLIQGSDLSLDAEELAVLGEHGFVISDRHPFPNFVYGYELIYAADLPLYVSADSILHAVHQSFDSLLLNIERDLLIPSLEALLASMRSRLPGLDLGGLDEQARWDADFYLAVAASLLAGTQQPMVAGADPREVRKYLDLVASEEGMVPEILFGTDRIFDFSQFTVRGHYTDEPALRRYFQAMMWLGRIDFRLIETAGDGTQRFHRRQLEAALVLHELLDAGARAHWDRIDRTVTAFTGVQDGLSLPEVDRLLSDLGAASLADVAALEDPVIAQVIVDGGYGKQQICSHIMINAGATGTLKLNQSFLLFGQRYLADSHVFSNVVYDRVPYAPPAPARGLPDPLDVAYAALGNDQAISLLDAELAEFEYAPHLARMRTLLDEHPPEYWESSLYNLWLGSLRALSPGSTVADPVAAGLPAVAGTEAWGRRLLNTQLASWAELRHDTLLYAKQSYTTGGTICEYPDAYVDPYPEFFAALVRFAERGLALVAELGLPLDGSVADYFERLRSAATTLGEMAERQRAGAPHDAEHIAFINRAVRTRSGGGGCGSPGDAVDAEGWYADLFLLAADRVAYDPSVADVHTQPTLVPPDDGATVGYVLHVGTGMARPLVVTVDTCAGPRAYVGLASSYYEQVTSNFERLTDADWAQIVMSDPPPADVPWMDDLIVP